MTRAAEFYAMDPDELESRLVEARRELLNLRFQLATGQLDNVAQLKGVRRDVARVLTILREMEIAQTEGVEFEAPVPQPARIRAQRRDAAEELKAEEIEIDVEDEEPEAAPMRARRSRKVEDIAEETSDAVEEVPETAPTRARGRRSRKVEDIAEETSDAVEEVPETAPTRARGRRSRKVVDTAEVPADADEEQ
jgi:large subunit ribosomal protein L29